MITNYFIIALRNIKRGLGYALINVLGLALGLAGSFVIGSWVWQELRYDTHFADHERIYRVSVSFHNSGAFASGPEIFNEVLSQNVPGVELATRLKAGEPLTVEIGGRGFEELPFYADSTFFQVFSYKFLGNAPGNTFGTPNSVVISETLALKYFGNTDVLGKDLYIGREKVPYVISGVVANTNDPSHIPAQLWLPMERENNGNWTSASVHNYVKLNKGVTLQQLKEKLDYIKRQWVYPSFGQGISYEELEKSGIFAFHVVPLASIHLAPGMRFEFQPGGNAANVNVFLAISILLVVIAAINFINLSTAQSAQRAKEVGIRKVLGTARASLVFQYLAESLVMSFIALLLGCVVAELFLILFENFTSERLLQGSFNSSYQFVFYTLGSLVIGLLAGIYPALHLSRFSPVQALKKGHARHKGSVTSRNVLVVLQFTASMALVSCSLLVYYQLEHMRSVDIGLDRNNVINIRNVNALGRQKEAFKQKLLSRAEVVTASFSKRLPAGSAVWVYSFQSDPMDQAQSFQTFVVDHDYLPTMGLKLIEGRNFSNTLASDSSAVILNRAAVKEMMLTNPVGAVLKEGATVVGVIEDFSYQSYYERPGPVVLKYDPEGFRLSVKVKYAGVQDLLDFMQDSWKAFSPDQPIDYTFLDKSFEQLMEKEKNLGRTVAFFTAIAVFISCLGLFGLAAYTTERRKKEVGIRKVMGATWADVMLLFNRGYTKLLTIAFVMAIPLTWYFIGKWLQNFEYRINIHFTAFLIAGMGSIIIAWLTVGYLSYRAATANPVNTLREE